MGHAMGHYGDKETGRLSWAVAKISKCARVSQKGGLATVEIQS